MDSSRAVPTGPAGRRHHCTGPRHAASRGAWHSRVGRPARACVLCCCALRAHGNAAQLQVRRAQAAVREDGSARYAVRRQCLAVEGAACCASCRVVLHLQYVSVVCAGVQRCVGLSAGCVRGELQLAPCTRLQLQTFDLSRIILTSLRPEAVSPLSVDAHVPCAIWTCTRWRHARGPPAYDARVPGAARRCFGPVQWCRRPEGRRRPGPTGRRRRPVQCTPGVECTRPIGGRTRPLGCATYQRAPPTDDASCFVVSAFRPLDLT